jgi:hypothetical protein
MKVIYRGECEELYGKELEYPDHECSDNAVWRYADHTETHGLDCGPYEHWHEEWWKCSICCQQIDEADMRSAAPKAT